VEVPTLLETLSYVFYFPSSIYGPSFEFVDFKKFIYLQGPYNNIPIILAIKAALVELFKGAIFMIVFFFFLEKYPISYIATEEFSLIFYPLKCIYLVFAMTIHKSKYFILWKFSKAGVILCGLGFQPEKNEQSGEITPNFNRIDTGDLMVIEFSNNPKLRTKNWNFRVHLWLKYFIFMRVLQNKKSKTLASLVTFLVSAVWHGFYPKYYNFFFFIFLLENASDILEQRYNLYVWMDNQNFLLKNLFRFLTSFILSYVCIMFETEDLYSAYRIKKNFYYIPSIILLATFLFLNLLGKKDSKEKKEN